MASLKVKELLCTFYTVLLFISGLILIGVSVYLSFKLFNQYKFIPPNSTGPYIALFLLGVIHLFLTWIGCRGPAREHDFYIIMFMIITGILLIIEMCVGIWSVVLWKGADAVTSETLWHYFGELHDSKVNEKWKKMEMKIECCGLLGASDYDRINKNDIPYYCCDDSKVNPLCPRDIASRGCKGEFSKFIEALMIEAACISFLVCLFQIFGLFLFYTFFMTLRKSRSERLARRAAMQRRISQENVPGNTPVSAPPATVVAPVVFSSPPKSDA